MIDFDRWFNRCTPAELAKPELPDGVFENGGKYFVTCRRCDNYFELPIDLSEVDGDIDWYCGGSPRCCP